MTDCDLCANFRDEHIGTSQQGVWWYCDHPEVTDEAFDEQLMDEADDCPGWYPGERQTVYTLGEGEWEHRCDRMPTDTAVMWDEMGRYWYFWPDETRILFCPWCGRELCPMPEVRG